jgi:hypothetical protein
MPLHTPDEFLYRRKGPWPQPATAYPLGEAPQVLHIPSEEEADWQRHIGRRYARDLVLQWPAAMEAALRERSRPIPDDRTFREYLLDTVYSRYLFALDESDRTIFAEDLTDAGPNVMFWKLDFSAMEVVLPMPGTWVAPTITLVRQDGDEASRRVVAIWCRGHVFRPVDLHAWSLAKVFVLQGAAYHILFVVHPALHFPMDSVNAITKTAVPMRHLLFRTLFPHTRFSLVLNRSVLEGPASVVSNVAQSTLYDPLTGDADKGLRFLFATGYTGYRNKDSYPAFSYRACPRVVPSRYGRFLEAYRGTIVDFTTEVAREMLRRSPRDPVVLQWGHYLRSWLRDFPEPDGLHCPGELGRVMGRYVWDVSVGHGADHASFSEQIPTVHKYLRIRVPPPIRRDQSAVAPERIMTCNDLFRASMSERMFFRPTTVTHLQHTQYDFDGPALFSAVSRFRNGLAETAETVEYGYMPLHELPASIQF